MRHRTPIAACAVALTSRGIAGGGSSGPSTSSGNSSSKTPFTVLAIVASSGPLAADTAPEIQGMQSGAKYVNARGGILVRKVQVIVKNDNDDPTTAATLLQKYLSGG